MSVGRGPARRQRAGVRSGATRPPLREPRCAAMTHDERAEQLARFATGFDEVVAALDGASDEELDRHGPAGWSARMVVHHLADSETTAYVRLRRLIGEDDPLLQDYDEEAFARRLHYDRPIARRPGGPRRGPRRQPGAPAHAHAGRVGAQRHAQRRRPVLGRGLAAHVRDPLARPRRADPPRAPRRGLRPSAHLKASREPRPTVRDLASRSRSFDRRRAASGRSHVSNPDPGTRPRRAAPHPGLAACGGGARRPRRRWRGGGDHGHGHRRQRRPDGRVRRDGRLRQGPRRRRQLGWHVHLARLDVAARHHHRGHVRRRELRDGRPRTRPRDGVPDRRRRDRPSTPWSARARSWSTPGRAAARSRRR